MPRVNRKLSLDKPSTNAEVNKVEWRTVQSTFCCLERDGIEPGAARSKATILLELCVAPCGTRLCRAASTLYEHSIPEQEVGLRVTGAHARGAGVLGESHAPLSNICGRGSAIAGTKLLCCPCCFMPCYYADNAALIDGTDRVTSWEVDCCCFSFFSLCCMGWLLSSTKRTELRYALGIEEDRACGFPRKTCGLRPPCCWKDKLTHFFCLPCALIQERKILELNNCTHQRPALLRYQDIIVAEPVEISDSDDVDDAEAESDPGDRDCVCSRDTNEGYDYCGVVCCGQQCGTGACCLEDKEGQLCACVLCEFQCDCFFIPSFIGALLTGTLCCPFQSVLYKFNIPGTALGLESTHQFAVGAGTIVMNEDPGSRMNDCCSGASCETQDGRDVIKSNCCLLCFPCCFMPCYYADSAAMIDGTKKVTSWSVDCCAFACFSACCLGWLVSSTKRTELRYAMGFKETRVCGLPEATCGLPAPCCWEDELTHFFCLPCALIQERKLLRANDCDRNTPAVLKHKEIITAQPSEAVRSAEPAGDSVIEAATDDCCCTRDTNDGFDLCGVVCCGQQCGTGACCLEDKDEQFCACVLCEFQFDCLFVPEILYSIGSTKLFQPFFQLAQLEIPTEKSQVEAIVAAARAADLKDEFSTGFGLTDCCIPATRDECLTFSALCATPCLVMPCYFANSAALIDGKKAVTSWSVDCVSFACFSLCCMGWLVSSTKRTELRYALGFREEYGQDCLSRFGACRCCGPPCCQDKAAHLCCLPCALMQERKLLKANGCTRAEPAVTRHTMLRG